MQDLFTKQNPEEKSSDYLTSADVTEEYKDAIERVRAKAREKANAPGRIVLQEGVVPPERLDREELLTWEERISARTAGSSRPLTFQSRRRSILNSSTGYVVIIRTLI